MMMMMHMGKRAPTTWAYFLQSARASHEAIVGMARSGYLWREAYSSNRLPRPYTRYVRPDEYVVLLSDEVVANSFRVKGVFQIERPEEGVRLRDFPAMARLEDAQLAELRVKRDPVLNCCTGFRVRQCVREERPELWHGGPYAGPPPCAMLPFNRLDLLHSNRVHRKRFLGVKVGYDPKGLWVGYCVVQASGLGGTIDVDGNGRTTFENFRELKLPRLMEGEFSVIAFTSITSTELTSPLMLMEDEFSVIPLTDCLPPGLGENSRSHERLLMDQAVAPGAKPQATGALKSDHRAAIHRAAMQIKADCEKAGYRYPTMDQMAAGRHRELIEVLPSAWVGALTEPSEPSPLGGHVWPQHFLCDGSPDRRLTSCLEQLGLLLSSDGMDSLDPEALVAATAAVAGGLYFFGWASALQTDIDGSFILPRTSLWATDWLARLKDAKNRTGWLSPRLQDIFPRRVPPCDWVCFASPDCVESALRRNVLPIEAVDPSSDAVWPNLKLIRRPQSVLVVETSANSYRPLAAMSIEALYLPPTLDTDVSKEFEYADLGADVVSLMEELNSDGKYTNAALVVELWRDASMLRLDPSKLPRPLPPLLPWQAVESAIRPDVRPVF